MRALEFGSAVSARKTLVAEFVATNGEHYLDNVVLAAERDDDDDDGYRWFASDTEMRESPDFCRVVEDDFCTELD